MLHVALSYPQARAMWRVVHDPSTATMDTVHNLFFYERGRKRRRIRPMDAQYNVSYEDAKAMASEARSTGNLPQPPPAPLALHTDDDGLPTDDGAEQAFLAARAFLRDYERGQRGATSDELWFVDELTDDNWVALEDEFDVYDIIAAPPISAPT